uniref:Fibronectin type-III domain-containing protein n=1 Tax=Leptobrachium leishanense TaxID=445787 RepID=A0A8C5R3Q7_9ANUR
MTGEKAPLDTKYSMYYRYGKTVEQCLQYVSEEDGQRHIGCRVPSSNINLLEPQQKITVLINGSSRTRDIRSIDHEYNIFKIEVLNVPRNVTLQKKNGSQTLVWTNPHSVYSSICFKYEVRIWNLWNNEDKIEEALEPKLENGPLQEPWKKHVFQVRAVTKILCMDNVLYSAWTEPLYIDTVSSNIYVVAACVCLIVVLLVFMHICLRYQLCGQMFPPVPKPKNDLKEIFLNVPPAPDFLVGERWDSWGGSVIISSIEVVCDSEKCINPPVPAGDVHRPPF